MTHEQKRQDQRLTNRQKEANDFQWYKDQADRLASESGMLGVHSRSDEYKRMDTAYKLFNNILNMEDFQYVCNPYGSDVGDLPANMNNRDISSGKIKALMGMEAKRPFSWRVTAVNAEATTRREQEEMGQYREYVINQIMAPIRQEEELKARQESAGRDLTPEEENQIRQQVEEATQARTPKEARRYMERDYQDPAEVMCHQLMEYMIQKEQVKYKFNKAWKHLLLSSKEFFHVGIYNGHPELWNVNSIRVDYDASPDLDFVEDAEWITCVYPMTPSKVIEYFGDEMTQRQIDDLYTNYDKHKVAFAYNNMFEESWYDEENAGETIPVVHCQWKSLVKVGFLTYMDETDTIQTMRVDENYRLDVNNGDIDIEWSWIPYTHETWKIGKDLYLKKGIVPGQIKDIDNLGKCKLSYYGAVCDHMNAQSTSVMDRLKVWQYYYNIVIYRMELLMASDKGKKIMMSIESLPDTAEMSLEKWQYYFDSSPVVFVNPKEEGAAYSDMNTMAREIDLSLASDIAKYINLAEFIKQQAGESVGITPQIEGQIGPNDAVSNTRQSIIQSSHILEPLFELHNHVKRNVLEALLETAKIAYSGSDAKVLHYVLDDMSHKMLTLDTELLNNSTLGIFVSNSTKAEEIKQTIHQLAHAAMQTQQAKLSDVIAVIRQEGAVEAEETLKVAEKDRDRELQAQQQRQLIADQQAQKAMAQDKQLDRAHELEKIDRKAKHDLEKEIVKSSIMGASFNPDQDKDQDGINDFIEIAKHGLEADIKQSKSQLEREKFEHQKEVDKENISIDKQKLKVSAAKSQKT